MLNVAIMGSGIIGHKRAQSIQHLRIYDQDYGRILFFCDDHSSRAQEFACLYGGSAISRWEDTVRDPNVDVVVVTDADQPLTLIVAEALRNGKHVLCEKPMGGDVQEAREIVKTARQQGLILKTGFNHRHHSGIVRARRLAGGGEIGKLFLIRCRYGYGERPGCDKQPQADRELRGGDGLLDHATLVVDLFRCFMGDFDEAFGYIPPAIRDMPIKDNVFAMFRTEKNQIASMQISLVPWKSIFSFEIFGEDGYLIIDGPGQSCEAETLRIGKRRRAKGELIDTEGAGEAPAEVTMVFDGPDISWEAEWMEFVSAIRQKREPLGSGLDGLEANRMIEAVYRSAREGRPVRIKDERERIPVHS
jgi:predicted dehydrogenase